MTDVQNTTDHYAYELPKERIAQHPLSNREDARLLTVDRATESIDHLHIRDVAGQLREGDCLVLNNTMVIPAKLVGRRTATGGRWQGLFLSADEHGNWKVLFKTRGSIQPGETVMLSDRHGVDRGTVTIVARLDDGGWVVKPDFDDLSTEEILQFVGRVPLPHYIRDGHMTDSDLQNYQTVFAKHAGAVAAPTAGLHLTKRLLREIIDSGVKIAQVTLHVGIGTFRPVVANNLGDHTMHFERGEIDQQAVDIIDASRARGGRVIAVGTTAVRVLETAGASGDLKPWTGETNLFIKPGYEFRVVDGLLTNFHLPRSTLLVMIRTFGGDELMQRAYAAAIEEEYRFYSYGDAMLIT